MQTNLVVVLGSHHSRRGLVTLAWRPKREGARWRNETSRSKAGLLEQWLDISEAGTGCQQVTSVVDMPPSLGQLHPFIHGSTHLVLPSVELHVLQAQQEAHCYPQWNSLHNWPASLFTSSVSLLRNGPSSYWRWMEHIDVLGGLNDVNLGARSGQHWLRQTPTTPTQMQRQAVESMPPRRKPSWMIRIPDRVHSMKWRAHGSSLSRQTAQHQYVLVTRSISNTSS